MITIIRAIGGFVGWEFFLIATALCLMMSFMLYWLLNRSNLTFGLFALTQFVLLEFCDIIWLYCFYPRGEYMNRGVMSFYVILLFPFLSLLTTAIIIKFRKRKSNR